MKVSWRQALAWRMQRQQLVPIGTLPVPEVVRRLCGVQAQVASSAELAIRLRRAESEPGEVGRALSDGRLIKTWAMRGTLHLLTPEDAGDFLSLMAAGRSWERPSWQRYFGMTPELWESLRPAVREALDGGPLTREELIAAVTARPGLKHVGEQLRSGWGTLLKPLAWQGDLCFGPSRGARVTFLRPEVASPRWAGVPAPNEAAPRAIAAYLGAYGPASAGRVSNWLSRGWIAKRQLRAWFDTLRARLVEIDVDAERMYVLAEHVDELAGTAPTTALRLLGGFDQWVLGAGTDDINVVPARRRAAVSRQAGWISPIVVAGGVVTGTWQRKEDVIRVGWFREAGRVPRTALRTEVERLSSILGCDLRTVIELS